MARRTFMWENFPYEFIREIVYGKETPLKMQPKTLYAKSDFEYLIPVDAIRDIVKGITYKGAFVKVKNSVLPVGWYDVTDEDGNDTKVLVFENQLKSYELFKADYEKYIEDETITGKKILLKYFHPSGMVLGENELDDLLRSIKAEKEFPEMETFDVRDQIEPFAVSQRIKEEKLYAALF